VEQFDLDLRTCADEPIHVPGSVMPHGVLLGLDEKWVVTHAGGDLDRYFARGWRLGRHIGEIVPEGTLSTLREVPTWSRTPGRNVRCRGDLIGSGGRVDCELSLHRNEQGVLVVEAEPWEDAEREALGVDEALGAVVNAQTETATLDAAVRAIRLLTGYQRVCAYVFDQDYNGTVISETQDESLEVSYLNQRFPASDIPEQARRLYKRKRARLISDIEYVPAAIEALPDAVSPLDLSDAELRSVSPIHIEYLRNMGVRATLVCTLLRDNDLLGMIACHHLEPKYVSPSVRSRAMVIADVAAARLATLRDQSVTNRMLGGYRENAGLLHALTREPESVDALGKHVKRLLKMIDATGAAVIIRDRVFTAGRVPQDRDIRRLSSILRSRCEGTVAVTDHLASLAPEVEHLRDVAAGVLCVKLDDEGPDAALWFRPEIVASVSWAGNPHKAVESDESGLRLTPRKSFDSYVELVRNRSSAWQDWEVEVAGSVRGSVTNVARQLTQLTELATERRQAEQSAREHAMELQAASEAMEAARDEALSASRAKSEFLANMSHEIRTPLTAILGYTELLSDDPPAGEPTNAATGRNLRDEAVETIRRSGEHLLAVINDILDLSKIEAGRMSVERVDCELPKLVGDVVSVMRSRADQRGVELRTVLETAVPSRVLTDPTRLRQVLMNIVGNAVKFTDEGRVEVRVRVAPAAAGEGRRLQFAVEDTGSGLTAEQAELLFRPFEQADTSITRRYGGTGLGLTISRRLATLMGGDVRLDRTEEGKGSTFSIDLPLYESPDSEMVESLPTNGEAARSSAAVSRGSASSGGWAPGVVSDSGDETAAAGASRSATPTPGMSHGEPLGGRVLLAEDGLDNQRLIGLYLKKAGVGELVTVADGKQALSAIEEAERSGERFDVLLTDMQMPELDGYSLASQLREAGSKMPIVALTAHAMAEDRQRCLDAGCDEYLSKPIDRNELVRVCRGYIEGNAASV